MGLTTRKLLPRAMVLPWADQRIRHRGQLPVAVVFRRLSEVMQKSLGVGLFIKISLTNGRLSGYLDNLTECLREEVFASFRESIV